MTECMTRGQDVGVFFCNGGTKSPRVHSGLLLTSSYSAGLVCGAVGGFQVSHYRIGTAFWHGTWWQVAMETFFFVFKGGSVWGPALDGAGFAAVDPKHTSPPLTRSNRFEISGVD